MRPWNIAHRGGAQSRPENTLAAFGYAATCGYDGVELDVQLTRDGEVVVFHDYRLKPEICRDGNGRWLAAPTPRIKDLSLAELRRYDIGRADPPAHIARTSPCRLAGPRTYPDAGRSGGDGEEGVRGRSPCSWN